MSRRVLKDWRLTDQNAISFLVSLSLSRDNKITKEKGHNLFLLLAAGIGVAALASALLGRTREDSRAGRRRGWCESEWTWTWRGVERREELTKEAAAGRWAAKLARCCSLPHRFGTFSLVGGRPR